VPRPADSGREWPWRCRSSAPCDAADGDTLSLEVENTSDDTINQIFFKGSDDVSVVSLASVSDGSAWAASGGSAWAASDGSAWAASGGSAWAASGGPMGTKAGGFGTFDFAFSSANDGEASSRARR